jgi:hypothetical protein
LNASLLMQFYGLGVLTEGLCAAWMERILHISRLQVSSYWK